MDDEPKFKKIFLVEPAHDFTLARKYTDTVVFLTTGEERIDEVEEKMVPVLQGFDPDTDAIVAMGRTVSCLIAGALLGSLLPGYEITYGIYQGNSYVFEKIKTFGIGETE